MSRWRPPSTPARLAGGDTRRRSAPSPDIALSASPGTYVLILEAASRRRVRVGALGILELEPGFYAYVGSARGPGGLAARLAHHRRRARAPHWHVDYLREQADLHALVPVRTSDDLECAMAAKVGKMAGWQVPRFGSSDCRCPSHLFGMEGDPLSDRGFIDLVSHFRIDRLQSFLDGKGKE